MAGARHTGDERSGPAGDIFSTIVKLRTGEALLFSPTAKLDVVTKDLEIESAKVALPTFPTLGDSYIKLRIRNRLTADGGKDIMALDTVPDSPSAPESGP